MRTLLNLKYSILLIISFFCAFAVAAQDTLPNFTVVAKPNNRNVISWTNTLPFVSQIIIQRSYDSLRNFKTILNVADPSVPQNGFVDTKAPAGTSFYRLFIVFNNGRYQFSRSRRPLRDGAVPTSEPVLNDNQRVVLSDSLSNKEMTELREKLQPDNPAPITGPKFFIIKRRGLIIDKVYASALQRYRDSIVNKTRDTLVFEDVDTVVLKPYVAPEIYRASRYIYAEKYGNVMIDLPDATKKKYSVQFFTESKMPLFEIKEIESRSLVVDKTNFIRSGWFWFELYEDGKLKERNRFFIPKDF
jgi:hypothetical protein